MAPPCSPGRIRTYDQLVNSQLLYRLSYRGINHWNIVLLCQKCQLFFLNFLYPAGFYLDNIVILHNLRYQHNQPFWIFAQSCSAGDIRFYGSTMDLRQKIKSLAKEKNAVILAHNYQIAEVQDAADFSGDSLELSQIAAKNDARMIVFCGVHFMAESASILSPRKKVVIPDPEA